MSRFSVENYLSHSGEKFRRGTFLCCVSENFWKRKLLWIRGGVVSGFSVDNILSHSAENLRRGTSLCFVEFLVSKKFMEKRGGTTISRRSFFLSHSSEKILKGTRLCFTNFLYRKMLKCQG